MQYKVWATEYRDQERILKEKIDLLKAERRLVQTSEKRIRLEERIYILYGMYLDCKHTAEIIERRAQCEQEESLFGA
ncbi:MAG: hypothetical protein PUC88_03820 [Clostridia bacterium]|nr:hypothetical protein [Clostridia bacterium]